ncbi:hypothetical protein AVEN_213214-1 [Araneus ventricosus]|uniref:XLR/SYCP3/FAM9 domain-containing protein n=2 Tax=Araneus ventricosus TaxID=182803 RepID=A0A4Y2MYZ6_ARAVE|nr:hypothetical protein AVEN_176616-1 [Araneus ventricosus]GBN31584.1 hypothetical protein AVEN_213214-1 [Araneus ventricosus]
MEGKEKAVEVFKSEFYTMAQQATDELKKMKQVEEKIENLLKLKEKGKEKERKAYFLQLQEFKKLNEEFSKGMHDLELNQSKQCAEVLDELRRDISQLQKKILVETQQKEMGNIRKHLKQSLF